MRKLLMPMLLALCLPAFAQSGEQKDLTPVPDGAPPPPPPAPPKVIKGGEDVDLGPEALEPTVTIRTEGEKKIEEYRIRGRLYMVKVKPAKGPAYFLVDKDNDGMFESRLSDLDPRIFIPKWVVTEW